MRRYPTSCLVGCMHEPDSCLFFFSFFALLSSLVPTSEAPSNILLLLGDGRSLRLDLATQRVCALITINVHRGLDCTRTLLLSDLLVPV